MSDLISRKQAIEEVKKIFTFGGCHCDVYAVVGMLNGLPSAEPERKTGEWIIERGYDGDEIYQCPECHAEFVLIDGTPEDNEYEYCPKCGAHLKYVPKEEEDDEDAR